MTEETPFNPCSRKGEIRAKIATTLINEWKSGALAGDDRPIRRFLRPRHAERRSESSRLPAFRPEAEGVMARE